MSVKFSDYGNEVGGSLNFGQSLTKQFTIENTGTIDTSIRMSFVDLINTYTEGSLTYTLSYSENASGPFTEIISKTNIPKSLTPTKRTLASTLTIPVNKTYYYNLVITLNYLNDVNQDDDLKAVFSSKFSVEDINQKYQVSFDPNGGTVDTSDKTITENTEYGTLPIPTRENTEYEFLGWFTEIDGGIEVTEETLVENFSNHTLYAHWGIDNTMMLVPASNYSGKLWKHKADIKKIVFEPTMAPKAGATYTYDLSEKGNGSVMTYLVKDTEDSTKYIAYIQSEGKIKANPNSSNIFYQFSSMESIEGLENIDTSNVTDMRNMFENCSSLTSLDVSSFDTSNVTSMYGMFGSCDSLTSLDISNFDTSNVTDMFGMFSDCSSLTSLGVSNFDTSNVTSMQSMFYGCNNLTSLDVSNFNTSNVTNMNSMFDGCSSLTSLDVSNFDTSNVTNMGSMFNGCSSLTSLDLNNFDTGNVTSMQSMFSGCNSLTSLDTSSFDTGNVTDMSGMFRNCSKLESLNLSNFKTDKTINMSTMFQDCSKLTTLNISNFDISSIKSKIRAFEGILSSIKITVGNNTIGQWVIDSSTKPKLSSSNIVIG